MNVALNPFHIQHVELSWGWLQEYPKSNFDDYGPKTIEDWTRECLNRNGNENEWMWTVTLDGEPVGIIGLTWSGGRLAVMHGICFTKSVHRKGVAQQAMEMLLAQLFGSGVQRIEAYSFALNLKVHRFLKKLGFQQEGILRQRTMQDGKPIDVRLVAALSTVKAAPPVANEQMQEVCQ